ncbi:MAG: ribosome-associated translation inhibitor RaiA [Oscillospiraceae bacterium]|jgi:putative sigma-54 modulation protein|nr:ribosome-associated translation inhibitor RaiA [Oscillospiraceae bacterium]
MRFTYNEKRAKITDELKAYAEKKLSKIDRLFRDEGECTVAFYLERGRHGLEVTINFSGTIFRVSELTHDQFACIDSAVAAVERQVRKNKTKLSKRLRAGIKDVAVDAIPYFDEEPDDDAEFKITKLKRFSIKPMSPEEAILQMNLLGHEFFAFRNESDSNAFSVVYKRKDGTYGQITGLAD